MRATVLLAALALVAGVWGEVFDVRAFGARGDGRTKDTAAIQRAVDAAHEAGGGTVEVPAGTYLSGSIFLKSNVDFHVGAGATILGSPDPADYNPWDVCPQNWKSVNESHQGGHLLLCIEQRNVTLRGPGRIDGNSRAFLVGPKGERYPQGGFPWRPSQMVYFVESEDIRIQDLELANSCYWSCFLHGCRRVFARGLDIHNVRTGFHTHNGDGLDIDCSQHVTVSDCRIDTADDCITLRGDCSRLKRRQDCAFVTVSNCQLSSPCNAIRVGVGEGRVHDATFSNILVHNSRTAVNLVSSWNPKSRGVDIWNLSFSNFRVDAFLFCQLYSRYSRVARFDDIVFSDIAGTQQVASEVSGAPDRPANRIVFRNVDLPHGVFARNVEGLEVAGGTFRRVELSEAELAARAQALDTRRRVMWDELGERPAGLTNVLHGAIADCARWDGKLGANFDKALAFLRRPDLATLPVGRYEIDGENCWAMVQEADLKPFPQAQGEAHRRYADIQVPLTGPETIGVCELPRRACEAPFDAEKDYGLYPLPKAAPLDLKPGEYAVFFPWIDAHMPGCTQDGTRKIRKLVIKVRMEDAE